MAVWYDTKYADGIGFGTKPEDSFVHHLASWFKPKQTVLDIGCGLGHDCKALKQYSLEPLGVDYSGVGIQWARKRFPDISFECHDLINWEPAQTFDAVWCAGMSWYHYDLDGTIGRSGVDVPKHTKRIMSWLKPGGLFFLLINTDLSGCRPDDKEHYNGIADYFAAFKGFKLRYLLWQRQYIILIWENTPADVVYR